MKREKDNQATETEKGDGNMIIKLNNGLNRHHTADVDTTELELAAMFERATPGSGLVVTYSTHGACSSMHVDGIHYTSGKVYVGAGAPLGWEYSVRRK